MKLINMTDYVLEQSKRYFDGHIVLSQYEELTRSYANFIKQPLALWMFVPCDENGKVFTKPFTDLHVISDTTKGEIYAYNKAQNRCLFEGFITREIFNPSESFEVVNGLGKNQICIYKARPDYFVWNYKTVEDLCKLELTLTETALKTL